MRCLDKSRPDNVFITLTSGVHRSNVSVPDNLNPVILFSPDDEQLVVVQQCTVSVGDVLNLGKAEFLDNDIAWV